MEARLKLDSILEKQRKRYLVLLRIYELTDGNEQEILQLEPPEGLDEKELMPIVDYLAGEGLIHRLATEAPLLQISHLGVTEVEQSLVNPQEPTEHFVATVIQHFHGNVGSVQTGNQSVANVIQHDNSILELLQQLRSHLIEESPDVSRDANELLDGLQSEVTSAKPSQSRMKAYLLAMGSFVKETGKDLLVEIGSKLMRDQVGL